MHTARKEAGKTRLGEVLQKDKWANALRGFTTEAKGKSEWETVFPLSETYWDFKIFSPSILYPDKVKFYLVKKTSTCF